MDDVNDVATPNEVLDFLEKRTCRFCNSSLEADERSLSIEEEYSCSGSCAEHDYYFYVFWTDPKNISPELELLEWEFEDNKYILELYMANRHFLVKSKGLLYVQEPVAIVIVNDLEFRTKLSNFDNIQFTEESLSKRIDTIRLLK